MKDVHGYTREPDFTRVKSAYALLSTDPERALEEFRALADKGSLWSVYYIGYAHESGLGTPKHIEKARECYDLASRAGSAYAPFRLGRLHWLERDYDKAAEHFALGASRDDPRSMYWLAILCLRENTSDSVRRAIDLLKRAFALGHLQSGRKLGKLLMSGRFGILNAARGFFLFLKIGFVAASLANSDPSHDNLADLPLKLD